MTERDAGDYIQDIIDAMEAAGSFIEGMSYDEFIADRKTVYAYIPPLIDDMRNILLGLDSLEK